MSGVGFTIPILSARLAAVSRFALWQEQCIKVMCLLPGTYRYEQVEAAVWASGMHPNDLYESLAANQHTFALARFYEALNGPQK